ncbi:hypothetical protein Xsto_03888 [Xenorhabdus stockiae]|uniref:Uncharacterized protein n=2 Tax=Xenorhabdus stockiae TaxID=351614 RepID=A0A2D0KAV1_9GAMM|nr:hypothetical protein Xsto_03888 [Xenorhabdus stockiae]
MLNEYGRWLSGLKSTLAKVAREISQEYRGLNRIGRKKPNSETLASTTVQALAVGTNGQLPEQNYCTGTQKNKQGVTSC